MVSDDYSGVDTVTIDDETISGTNGIYTYTAEKNGTYTVIATDIAGNSATVTFTVSNIDKTCSTITGAENSKTYDDAVTIKVEDSESGIKSAEITKDSSPYTYTAEADGSIKLSEEGSYDVKVTDNAGNETSISFTVKSISIKTNPSKTSYYEGEDLDRAGGVIIVTYSDGSTKEVSLTDSSVTVSGYDSSEVGEQTITVTYEGLTCEYKVTVVEIEATKLEIVTLPSKTSYLGNCETIFEK